MKRLLILTLTIYFLALTVFSQSTTITVIETVKIKDNKRAEALFYYENNWKLLREKALEKGSIHSYELIEATADEKADFDIVLVTRYAHQAQFDKSEENFQKLIKELITDKGGLKLKNKLKPADFRQNMFVKIGKSINL
jgi:hypothetical protein